MPRFWRLVVLQNNGDASFLNFDELELRESVGGPSVAQGGSVTQSSQYDASTFAAANLFDGAADTTWATLSGQTTGWVQYELPIACIIRQFAIRPRGTHLFRASRRFRLDASYDGAVWLTGAEYDYTAWSSGALVAFDGWRGFWGVVRDQAGQYAAREVVAMRESTKQIVRAVTSDAVTGAYSMTVHEVEPHTLIFRGEPDRNDLIYRGVVPQ